MLGYLQPNHSSMRFFIFIYILPVLLFSCHNEKSEDTDDDTVSSIVNIPVGPDQIIDTSVAAHFLFENTTNDFDTLQMGQSYSATYHFTNTGKRPAIISDIKTSCGCTATSYTTEPILPGKKGEIEVTFNSTGKLGYQKNSINVIGNTYPPRTLLYLQGFVKK